VAAALAVALAVVGTLPGSRLRQRGEPVERQVHVSSPILRIPSYRRHFRQMAAC
jgi:hypothetical protein